MRKILTVAMLFSGGLFLLHAFAQTPSPPPKAQRKFLPIFVGEPVMGIPYEEAMKIAARYTEEFKRLPGVVSVGLTGSGLVVATIKPEALPAAVEGMPVIPVFPSDPGLAYGLKEGLRPPGLSIPQPDPPPVVEEPPLADCPSGMHRVPGEVRCRFDQPPPVEEEPKVTLIPPPAGVIVLRPGQAREQAESCPQGFEEVEGYNKWRFCVDPINPEKIPPLWSPPIAGIPYEKALEIHRRHVHELGDLPGVESVGLGAEGINVYTTRPELVPQQVEGLKVIPRPVGKGVIGGVSHTYPTPVRPLHGAVMIADNAGGTFGTLTGVVVADGEPWLVFPAHLLAGC